MIPSSKILVLLTLNWSLAQWTNHFSSIATSQSHSNSLVAEVCKKVPTLTSLSKLDIVDDLFTVEEVELALKRLKVRKAGGIDGLQPEHL